MLDGETPFDKSVLESLITLVAPMINLEANETLFAVAYGREGTAVCQARLKDSAAANCEAYIATGMVMGQTADQNGAEMEVGVIIVHEKGSLPGDADHGDYFFARSVDGNELVMLLKDGKLIEVPDVATISEVTALWEGAMQGSYMRSLGNILPRPSIEEYVED